MRHLEHAVDAAAGALDHPGPLGGVGQHAAAWLAPVEQLVQPDAVREAARVRDDQGSGPPVPDHEVPIGVAASFGVGRALRGDVDDPVLRLDTLGKNPETLGDLTAFRPMRTLGLGCGLVTLHGATSG
jgi:hypothetical protein